MSHPDPERGMPVTVDEAEDLGEFTLAAGWADRVSWPMPGDKGASDHLAELTCMSALARWLGRWRPVPIHKAILAGAEPPSR
jgi:hypothetical protein